MNEIEDPLKRSFRRGELLTEAAGVRAKIAVIQSSGPLTAPVTAEQAAEVQKLKSLLADLEKQIAALEP